MNKSDLKFLAENLIETFHYAGKESIKLFEKGLRIEIKEDKSPVSNGDLKVDELISNKISQLTPDIPIISEETVDLNKKNQSKIFWLIDPIDGTKEYIAGKDEYTLNAGLIINTVPVLGLVGVPKKRKLFYSYSPGESYLIEDNKTKKINCEKKQPKNQMVWGSLCGPFLDPKRSPNPSCRTVPAGCCCRYLLQCRTTGTSKNCVFRLFLMVFEKSCFPHGDPQSTPK